MQIYRTSLYLTRIVVDLILVIAVFLLSAFVSLPSFNFFKEINSQFLLLALLIIWFFSTRATALYDEFRSRNYSYELLLVIKNIIVQVISVIVILFLVKENNLSRYFVLIYSGTLLVAVAFTKYLLRRLLIFMRRKGKNSRSLLIIGAGEVGRNFYQAAIDNPHFGYHVIGFLDDETKPFLNGQYLGGIENLNKILNSQRVDDVIVALPNYAHDKVEEVVMTCENHTTRVRIIPDYFKFVSSKYNVSMFGRFPIISVREDRISELHWRLLKRTFDFMFASLLYLFIFSWFFPIIIVLQKILNPGPIFYKAKRWGRNNKEFVCYKYRSMLSQADNVDEHGNHIHTKKNDSRLTKFGGFLRKTNIDELPQFWNVLKGDMSIVGPRPHDVEENLLLKNQINAYMYRHIIKPGITGWAQVNGYRGGTNSLKLMKKRTEYDLWYIENWTFWLDMQIILQTIWNMIKGDKNAY